MENFKYCGTILTHQNCGHEEIYSRFRSKNFCYLSAQNLLFSNLLTKNIKIFCLFYVGVKLDLSY